MFNAEFWVNVIVQLLITIVGILVVLLIERQRRPNLRFQIAQPNIIPPNDQQNRMEYKWLAITVANPNTPRCIRWVYPRDTAIGCQPYVVFRQLDGTRIFDYDLVPPWDGVAEPEITKIERIVTAETRVDIQPGEHRSFHFVGRARNDTECFGWTNEAYLIPELNWRDPRWRLERGQYVASMRVNVQGREFVQDFLIVNDGFYEEFCLTPLNNEQRKRLRARSLL